MARVTICSRWTGGGQDDSVIYVTTAAMAMIYLITFGTRKPPQLTNCCLRAHTHARPHPTPPTPPHPRLPLSRSRGRRTLYLATYLTIIIYLGGISLFIWLRHKSLNPKRAPPPDLPSARVYNTSA